MIAETVTPHAEGKVETYEEKNVKFADAIMAIGVGVDRGKGQPMKEGTA